MDGAMLPALPVPRDRSLLHALTPYALAASGLCSPRAPPARAFPDRVRRAPVRYTYARHLQTMAAPCLAHCRLLLLQMLPLTPKATATDAPIVPCAPLPLPLAVVLPVCVRAPAHRIMLL